MEKKFRPKCKICGKWVSYADLDGGEAAAKFTPDTLYTSEKTEYFHRKCYEAQG